MTTDMTTSAHRPLPALVDRIKRHGLHLHYQRLSGDYGRWLEASNTTRLCGTERCFKLKIRNLTPETDTKRADGLARGE